MSNEQVNPFIQELELQAKAPPDLVFGHLYKAFLQDLEQQEGPCRLFLERVAAYRDLTPTHFVNILARASQYVMLSTEARVDYPHTFKTVDDWIPRLPTLFGYSQDQHGSEIEKLVIERHTSTTIYNRYSGPEFILRILHDDRPVRVIDLGCGRNYLRGWDVQADYSDITDRSGGIFRQTLTKRVRLTESLAVDDFDPEYEENVRWARACLYPSELDSIPKIEAFESKLAQSSNVRFLKLNLTQPDSQIPTGQYNAAILATFLYQFKPEDQQHLLELASRLVNEQKGIVIVADFAQLDSLHQKLNFIGNWHNTLWPYGVFIKGHHTDGQFLEILRGNSGRVREVKEGKDLTKFLSLAIKFRDSL